MLSNVKEFYQDKNILIIGATSGISKAICQEFSKYEVNLYLTSRKADNLKLMEKEVLNSKAFRVDIGEEDSIRSMFNRVDDLDIVINLAGHDVLKPFSEFSKRDIQSTVKVNFESTITLMQYALNEFARSGEGIYVQINAFSGGKLAMPYFSLNCASRAATASLCRSLRREYSDSDIRIVLFSPPATETENALKYTDIWEMSGIKLADSRIVAKDFVEGIALGKDDIIMGSLAEKGLGYIDVLSPQLADMLFYHRFTGKVRDYFSGTREDNDNE